ncbi:MAG: SUF system NifU family Fe-S cluster assembly protein [Candidatus Zixiibacteriota bacterium]|nr:MAG: SUF system NifU family Fe-S cluster assembly protein [candidate division Zixibacteria bacterium]
MAEELDEMYRDIIMEHYRYPRGHEKILNPDIINEGHNPVCGDEIEIKLKMDKDKIETVSVNCAGCAISTASGSMLAEICEGKTIAEVKKIAAIVKALLKGEEFDENIEIGDIEALQGVKKFPVRVKCALLSWTTLVDAINTRETGATEKRLTASTTES